MSDLTARPRRVLESRDGSHFRELNDLLGLAFEFALDMVSTVLRIVEKILMKFFFCVSDAVVFSQL